MIAAPSKQDFSNVAAFNGDKCSQEQGYEKWNVERSHKSQKGSTQWSVVSSSSTSVLLIARIYYDVIQIYRYHEECLPSGYSHNTNRLKMSVIFRNKI